MAVSDNFDAYGTGNVATTSGGAWAQSNGSVAVQTFGDGKLSGALAASYHAAYRTESFGAAQSAQVKNANGENYLACAVRITSSNDWYGYFDYGGIQRIVAGVFTELAVRSAWAATDIGKIAISSGDAITVFKNSVQDGSALSADHTIPSGAPGAGFFGNTVTYPAVDDFVGTGELGGGSGPTLPFITRLGAMRTR
jgi:hypothetical protein